MTPSLTLRWIARPACACLATVSILAADPQPVAQEKGDLWEVTSQMSMEGMEGMNMPPQTSRVCSDRQWSKPPVGGSDNGCQMLDVKSTATKSTWKVRCDGPPVVTGEGEIVRSGGDGYTGWMKMTSPDGVMTMKLNGRKVGECDVAAAKKQQSETIARAQAQAAAAEQQQAASVATVCQSAVTNMDLMLLTTQGTPCTDPGLKTAYCTRLQTREGFMIATNPSRPPGYGASEAAALCNVNLVESKQKLCREALEKEDLDFLGKECPKETQQLAQRECAGRKYSAMAGSKYQSFCATYAADVMAGGKDAPPEEAKPETTKQKTKKLLKGLFP